MLTATGYCKFDTLLRYYDEFFRTVTEPAFQKEYDAWRERNDRYDSGNGPEPGVEPIHSTNCKDELDDIFLKQFKMVRSRYYEGDRSIFVVNGFCLREHQQKIDLSELDS